MPSPMICVEGSSPSERELLFLFLSTLCPSLSLSGHSYSSHSELALSHCSKLSQKDAVSHVQLVIELWEMGAQVQGDTTRSPALPSLSHKVYQI